ncbi:hypothetical protein JVU11DRAFT_2313 [Chiua virens]|nr:hypothetical protein JVU11DRAFT_2313 [Chiua virens]
MENSVVSEGGGQEPAKLCTSISLPTIRVFGRGLPKPSSSRPQPVQETADISLLTRPVTAHSVVTSIPDWKQALRSNSPGLGCSTSESDDSDWTLFKITRLEHRKRTFLSHQHEFVLRDVVAGTKNAGVGEPDDTLFILSPDDLRSLESSSILLECFTWGVKAPPSFSEIVQILNHFADAFPKCSISRYNCYHFCAIACKVISKFPLGGAPPRKFTGKHKGRRFFWMRVLPDSIIFEDAGKILVALLRDSEHRFEISKLEGKGKGRALE